ncbi:MAG: M28 family metallopeptidase [Lachnospiraceae bacterium]|nr:M28 family metallopeptidase [Lachnospiraceae bacterium]
MNKKQLNQIFVDTDFVHWSGSDEELQVAEYLKKKCGELGVEAEIEAFDVPVAEIEEAHLYADGVEIPCKAFFCCGSGEVEAELYYMPGTDAVSIAGAKDKIVLLDTGGVSHFVYQDLMKAGAKGILFQYGNAHYDNKDIDERDLRASVVGDAEKVLCATINVRDAVKMVSKGTKKVKLTVKQNEEVGHSHNVVATIPGIRDEYIVLSAHYDTTRLSHGAYDNMTGCVGLLGVMEAVKAKQHNYGFKFVFCGSEERGLLGSKAYVAAHEEELEKYVLNINLDMIGTIMGKFIARVTAEERLASYISYMAAEVGFPVAAKTGVYSSDSTSFADKGVPSLSFARLAGGAVAPIHCRYDLKDVLSMKQLSDDIDFIVAFTKRMADAAVCPVEREIPDKIKTEIDEYLARKRKKN